MQNLRALRQRIRSVQNTQKITRAMQMVAGSKLRRAQGELFAFRPYAQRLVEITQRFLASHPGLTHPLLGNDVVPMDEVRHSERQARAKTAGRVKNLDPSASPQDDVEAPAGLIFISSDTGLCGTYNERVWAAAEHFLREFPSAQVVTIGRKGNRMFARRGVRRFREVLTWGGRYDPAQVNPFVDWMEEKFLRGEISGWHVAHTQFISALSWKPVVAQLLPLERPAAEEFPVALARGSQTTALWPEKLIVEPDAAQVAEKLLKQSVRSSFARILLEAFTAEHSARMVAMKNATENADGMIKTLTLTRNKARQAAITKELIEVVSGAQALS